MAESIQEPLHAYVNRGFQKSFLTSNDKSWLGKRIRIHGDSPQVLAERYHLNINTLKKYARCDGIGLATRATAGRPPLLEEYEITEISDFILNLGLIADDLSIPEMRIILETYFEHKQENQTNA